ncbi:MAG: hypothetical protein HY921_01055 [Elusimicrobia bacterium]|nr:hypothetical protein [Elusimicrobiota bacterium]
MNTFLKLALILCLSNAAAAATETDFSYLNFHRIQQSAKEAEPSPGSIPIPSPRPTLVWAWPYDRAQPPDMPAIGKWMIGADGRVAHWLKWGYGPNVQIDEPINVIIRIRAETMAAADEKLRAALERAGFSARSGHSSGYEAYLGPSRHRQPQRPQEEGRAYADNDCIWPNDHGRLFGPIRSHGAYYVIGAFSREDAPLHSYISFQQARDTFARKMRDFARATIGQPIPLENAVPKDFPTETTGDHDGFAVLVNL